MVKEIWELEDGEIKKYTGNYREYRNQKEIEEERKRKEYENYQAEKKRLKERIHDNPSFLLNK